MNLVQEEQHLAARLPELAQDGLEPLLELPAIGGPGDEQPQVEADQALAPQGGGYFAALDSPGQSLDDLGLSDARISEQDRVVGLAPGEHRGDAPHLGISTDHVLELAGGGLGGEVDAEGGEDRSGPRDAVGIPDRDWRRPQLLEAEGGEPVPDEDGDDRVGAVVEDRGQDVGPLDRLLSPGARFGGGAFEVVTILRLSGRNGAANGQAGLRPPGPGPWLAVSTPEERFQVLEELPGAVLAGAQGTAQDAGVLTGDVGQEEVLQIDLVVPAAGRELLRRLEEALYELLREGVLKGFHGAIPRWRFVLSES